MSGMVFKDLGTRHWTTAQTTLINIDAVYSFMSRKSQGINAERELLHQFWGTGEWIAMRAPASGSMKYPCPDLLVGNLLRKLAIECKTTKANRQYLDQEQVKNLKTFSQIFGAEPYVGVRFKGEAGSTWYFLSLDDIERTAAENYVISKELAERKGLLFEELIR